MDTNDTSNKVHVYDGIVEENNPMPGWWVGLFILCIIFAIIYWMHYTFGGGETLTDEYNKALAVHQAEVEKFEAADTVETEESLQSFMQSENATVEGARLFAEKCAMCHGDQLEGKIGPNLTDHYWVNGRGSRMDVVNIIKKGSAAKGMPAWESMLKPAEIKKVSAFVFSKIGTTPVNAKAPEGNLHE